MLIVLILFGSLDEYWQRFSKEELVVLELFLKQEQLIRGLTKLYFFFKWPNIFLKP
jgi:hypothetical protein